MSRIAYTLLFHNETEENAEGLNFLHLMDIDCVYFDDLKQGFPQRDQMLLQCCPGDAIICRSIAFCSRNRADFAAFARQAEKHGINLLCLEDDFDLSKFRSKYQLMQMEQELPEETVQEAAEPAEQSEPSSRRGRKPKEVSGTEFERLYQLLQKKQITKKEMQAELEISYPTLMKLISAKEEGVRR